MCKDHGKAFGSKAVELFAEARVLNNVCDARFEYLKKQAMSFHAWLDEQGCDDPTAVCSAIVHRVETLLKEQGPSPLTNKPDDELNPVMFDTMAGLDDPTLRREVEDDGWMLYQTELEDIATKSAYTMEAKLHWYKAKLYPLQQMLSLHDRIQDVLDTVPSVDTVDSSNRKRIKDKLNKYTIRLLSLRKEGKLSWYDWALFQNQINQKRNYSEVRIKFIPQYTVADRVAFYEQKLEEARNQIETDILIPKESRLPAENYVALHDEVWG